MTEVYGILYRFLQCLHLKFAATQKKVEVTPLSSNQLRTKIKSYYRIVSVLYIPMATCGFLTKKYHHETIFTDKDNQHTQFLLSYVFFHRSLVLLKGSLKHRGRVVCCCLPLSLCFCFIIFIFFFIVVVIV